MKSFLATFVVCLVLCFLVVFFAGAYLVQNPWLTILLIALFLSVLIDTLIRQSDRLEALEHRVKELEKNTES